MSEKSPLIERLRESIDSRTGYVKAKVGVLVPSQIRALRLRSNMPRQSDLAKAAKMQQSRISMFETPGAANVTLDTLARLAAAFKVGLVVKFVPLSEMLDWEDSYSQDTFQVNSIENDASFLNGPASTQRSVSGTGPTSFAMTAASHDRNLAGSNARRPPLGEVAVQPKYAVGGR